MKFLITSFGRNLNRSKIKKGLGMEMEWNGTVVKKKERWEITF